MELANNSDSNHRVHHRAPLACLECRSRHLKCNGQRPTCNRCSVSGTACEYTRSRRGGLTRAALAKRRSQAASNRTPTTSCISPIASGSANATPLQQDHRIPQPAADGPCETDHPVKETNISQDRLVTTYYQTFHRFHPIVLPRRDLQSAYASPKWRSRLEPVVQTIRLIGHVYANQQWPQAQSEDVGRLIDGCPEDEPLLAQACLLYSIALFWQGFHEVSRRQMDKTLTIARIHKIYLKEFADQHAPDGPVWMESWRRTWWMIYAVDAYYVGTLGTAEFSFSDLTFTAELPCEDREYEAGIIPPPKTLQDMQNNEFAEEETIFSSFAYLIGAVQCASLAIVAANEPDEFEPSTRIVQRADAVIDSWALLVPETTKPVMLRSGQVDELMFQAHLLIHVASIGLHRPLSDLKFNPVEALSTCARDPPPDLGRPDVLNIHTLRVLRSVAAQVRLLTLPARPFNHTPFTTCMVNEGVLALLSACNYLFRGKDLEIARAQLRMTIGCLQTLAQSWPRIASNIKETKTIARHVLSLDAPTPVVAADALKDAVEPPDNMPLNSNIEDLLSQDVETLFDWYTFEGFNNPVTDTFTADFMGGA